MKVNEQGAEDARSIEDRLAEVERQLASPGGAPPDPDDHMTPLQRCVHTLSDRISAIERAIARRP